MALVQALVKSPPEFVYGDNFVLFYERFNAFISGAKCEPSSVFSLLLSYLDDASFKKVKALTFSDDHKTDDHIDISKKLTYDFIKEALTHDKVPAQIQLRYRIQGKNETPSEFGEAIRTLGNNAYGNGCEQNQTVIESFCIGLKSTELSAKMLQKSFTTLTQAVDYADQRNKNQQLH